MKSIKVLMDTNNIISGLFFKGLPKDTLIFCLKSKLSMVPIKVKLIIPEYVKDEVKRIIKRKFQKEFTHEIELTLDIILNSSEPLTDEEIKGKISEAKDIIGDRDPKDVPVIAAVLESKPDYLITGDSDMLDLGKVGETEIINATKFMEIMEELSLDYN